MSDSIIERAAWNMYENEKLHVLMPNTPDQATLDIWKRRARAAIEAMREPSEAMKRAADSARPMYDDPPTSGEEYWETMIDAALPETTPA